MSPPQAILFDMDGTLTRPNLDFAAMRRRIGVPDGSDIIGYIKTLPPPQAAEADAIVEDIEIQAAQEAQLNPGAHDLLADLRQRGLPLALITNNHRAAMQLIIKSFDLHFDVLLSREDAPSKPAPDLLFLALERLSCPPPAARFVGDGRYDRLACQAAGIAYIHLSHDQKPLDGVPTAFSLDQVPGLLFD